MIEWPSIQYPNVHYEYPKQIHRYYRPCSMRLQFPPNWKSRLHFLHYRNIDRNLPELFAVFYAGLILSNIVESDE